jgi:hypothetical protein
MDEPAMFFVFVAYDNYIYKLSAAGHFAHRRVAKRLRWGPVF